MSILQKAGSYLARTLRRSSPDRVPRVHPDSFRQLREAEVQPEWGWTLNSLQAAIQALSLGDMWQGQRLQIAMLRDTVIAHAVETRAESLTQVNFCWQKPEQCPQAYFDLWVENSPEILSASDHIAHGETRILLGVSPANVTWGPDPSGRIWIPRCHLREPGNLTWRSDPEQRRYYFTSIGPEGYIPVDNDGERWVLFQRAGRRPHLAAAALSLAIPWFFKAEALRGWPTHNRSHVKPERVLKVPAGQREGKDVQLLISQVQNLVAGSALILPQYGKDEPSFDYALVEAKADSFRTFAELIRLCDAYMTTLLLGASENTGGSSASNAKAQVHDRVALRKVKSDAKSSAEALTILSRCAARMNSLEPRHAPIPIFEADPPEDQDSLAERQQRRADALQKLGGFMTSLDQHNAVQGAKQVDYEVDYLAEQLGTQLTRAQDGQQSRPQ